MKYIEISNFSEIEVDALHLMGASDKRDDSNKIGMFGSGNKYSIAYLLRNKIEFHIYSGAKEIKIATVVKMFRDKEFNVMTINGVETSITDALGKDWKKEYIIREFVSNAIDETGFDYQIVDEIIPELGFTKIYVDYHAFNDVNLTEMFTFLRQDKPIFECDELKIYRGVYNSVYRKGISVYKIESNPYDKVKSMYKYDYDLANVEINEERQAYINRIGYEMSKSFKLLPSDIVYGIVTSKNSIDRDIIYYSDISSILNLNMSNFNGKVLLSVQHVPLFGEPVNGVVIDDRIYTSLKLASDYNKQWKEKYNFTFITNASSDYVYKEDVNKSYLIKEIESIYESLNFNNPTKDVILATVQEEGVIYFVDDVTNKIVVNVVGYSDRDLVLTGVATKVIISETKDIYSYSARLSAVAKALIDKLINY